MDIKTEIKTFRDRWYSYDKEILSRRRRYISLQEIEEKLEPSQFSIELEGWHFECLYKEKPGEQLYVIYDAAHEPGTRLPNFPRWSYHNLLSGSMLCIEDPMYYKYPEVRGGSFYGDEDISLVALSIEIIKSVCRKSGIAQDQVVFFSSSQAGYTSTYASTLMANTLSIAICPRLYIQDTPLTENFVSCTGIDLNSEDSLHRNDIVHCIRHSTSKHVMCFNMQHEHDWQNHGLKFCNEFGIEPHYGIVTMDNCLFWTYDCAGAPNPHSSFETKSIFVFIDKVAKAFKSGKVTKEMFRDALVVNECWHDIYDLKRENLRLRFNQTSSDFLYIGGGQMFSGEKIDGLGNITIAKRNHNYNFFRYNILRKNMKITIRVSGLEGSVNEFSAGVYDFKSDRRLHYEIFPTNKNMTYSFIVGENIEGLAFCVYAGVAGNTKGHELRIRGFEVFGEKIV